MFKRTDRTAPPETRSPAARLVAAEAATRVGPDDLTQPPQIEANPAAIDAYDDVAVDDATSTGGDTFTPTPTDPPSAGLVMSTATTPLVRLGQRFAAFHTLYTRGLLGVVTPEPVTRRQILTGLWPLLLIAVVLLGAAVTVEVIYGSAAADLLSRQAHNTALAAAIATTIAINGIAWILAEYAYRHHPHLARRRGLWIALLGFALIVVVVICLGLVIGGWDPLQITSVTGGGSTTVADIRPETRPLLASTYITLVLLTCLGIAAGHYLIKDEYDTRRVTAIKTNQKSAQDASLAPAEQQPVAAGLAQTYLDAIPDAEHHINTRLETYNATRTRHATPDTNDATTTLVYTPTTPLWTAQAHHLINLEHHPSHDHADLNIHTA